MEKPHHTYRAHADRLTLFLWACAVVLALLAVLFIPAFL